MYFVGSLFSSLITIQIKFFCCPTLFPDSIVGQSRLLPVARTLCPLLSAILSGLIPPRGNLWIYGRQVFTSTLERDDNRSATNVPDVITKTVIQLRSTVIFLVSYNPTGNVRIT